MGSLDRTFQVMTPTLTCRNTVDSEHFQSTPQVSETRMKAEMTWNDVLHGQMGANEKSTWIWMKGTADKVMSPNGQQVQRG